ELAQRALLARSVHDLARDATREVTRRDLEPVGPHVLDPERRGKRLDDLREPSRDERERPPPRSQLRDELARPRAELDLSENLPEHGDGEPLEGRDALAQGR